MVQYEFEKRKGQVQSGASPFSSKIVCGDCGSFYGSKIWHSNSKYRKVVWRCNSKFKNAKQCKTPHLTETQIKEAFVKEDNAMIENKEEIIKDCEKLALRLIETNEREKEVLKLEEKCDVMSGMVRTLIEENSKKVIDQNEYSRKYKHYVKEYESLTSKLKIEKEKEQELKIRKDKIIFFINELRNKKS